MTLGALEMGTTIGLIRQDPQSNSLLQDKQSRGVLSKRYP